MAVAERKWEADVAKKVNNLSKLARACDAYLDVYQRAADGQLTEGRASFMFGKRIEKLISAIQAVADDAEEEASAEAAAS